MRMMKMKTILTKMLRSSPGDQEENELPQNNLKTMGYM
jgi:hypothetical protein